MKAREFGARLKELRRQAGLSQSELAKKVGVNFTYLSKIESGAKSAPSEKVILRLARVLNADSDELMILAGRIPSDIVKKLKSPKNQFNIRLRELRKQAGMTQRELANKVGINFTYLSKLENGVLTSLSEKVISKLAEVLNTDKDELLILAGRVPSDVAEMLLKNSKLLQSIRAPRAQKISDVSNKVRASLQNWTRSLQNWTRSTRSFLTNHQAFSRVAISVAATVAILATLWVATPAQALNITVTNPSSGTLGSSYSFTIEIDIDNNDLLPLTSIDLSIYNVASPNAYTVGATNLPISNGPLQTATRTYTGAGGTVAVSGITGANWVYASGTRTGYGYGYQSGSWGYESFGFGYGYGYGYGGSNVGPTSITYTVTWTSPTTWPEGAYEISVIVYGNGISTAFTTTTTPSFTLSAAAEDDDGVGGGGAVGVSTSVTTDVFGSTTGMTVNSNGVVQNTVTFTSEDGTESLSVPAGTIAKDANGNPLSSLTAAVNPNPPAAPSGQNILRALDLGPPGATFSPHIVLTFSFDPVALAAQGISPSSLVVVFLNAQGVWEDIPGTIVGNTFVAEVSHFTTFALIGSLTPTPPVVEPPVEKPPVEKPPVEKPPVEKPPDETPPVEKPPVEKPPVEKPPVEKPPVEKPPVEKPPVEEVPAKPVTNWGLIGGIIAAVVVIGGLLVYFLWWRRRTA